MKFLTDMTHQSIFCATEKNTWIICRNRNLNLKRYLFSYYRVVWQYCPPRMICSIYGSLEWEVLWPGRRQNHGNGHIGNEDGPLFFSKEEKWLRPHTYFWLVVQTAIYARIAQINCCKWYYFLHEQMKVNRYHSGNACFFDSKTTRKLCTYHYHDFTSPRLTTSRII